MALADRIEQAVRRDLRQLELQKLNFQIARLTLVSATRQLEGARQRILLGGAIKALEPACATD